MHSGLAAIRMKVLVVHNEYRSAIPSGENVVMADEVAGLHAAGVDVTTYVRSSDELDSMGLADRARVIASPLTGQASRRSLKELLEQERPDVVHVHNPYPLISPRLISWCREARIPVVATIHNFRLRCMNGLLYRDGGVCTRCEESSTPLPGVLRGCYRDSRVQSVVMGAALLTHRNMWKDITQFIAVSDFVADRLLSWGFDKSQFTVKANPVDDPGPPTAPGEGFLFAGRLSEEKGIHLLLDSWKASGLAGRERLVIAGDGPLADLVRVRSTPGSGIEYVGILSREEIARYRRSTAVGVMCSRCFETHSSAAESFSHQRPVVATRAGALGQVVDESVGWLAEPTVESLSQTLRYATEREAINQRSSNARARFEERYLTSVVIDQLCGIYQKAIAAA
jgi:glycosyltransferase involved in cell wall biosynthesis